MRSPLEQIHPRNLKHLAHYLETLVADRLWAKILIGMACGIVVGIVLGPTVGWLVDPSVASSLGW